MDGNTQYRGSGVAAASLLLRLSTATPHVPNERKKYGEIYYVVTLIKYTARLATAYKEIFDKDLTSYIAGALTV